MKDIYDFYNLIGKNIKDIRINLGDTQENFAEKIEMSRAFISHLESQKVDKGVSLDTLFCISQKYNIDIREFFSGYEAFLNENDHD